MLLLDKRQLTALEQQGNRTRQRLLTSEISLIRAKIPGIDHATPPGDIIAGAESSGERYGLTTANDIRNLVITALFHDHVQVNARSVRLYEVLSAHSGPAKPLCAHLLALHVKNIEHDHHWQIGAQ